MARKIPPGMPGFAGESGGGGNRTRVPGSWDSGDLQEFLGFRAPSFAFVTGFVYFVEVAPDGPVKIGIADDPDRRLATLQNAHHEELRIVAVLPGDRWFERALHGRFLAGRIRGEWYRRDTPGLELMLDLAATAEGHFLETGKWTLDPAELGWDPQGAA